MERYTDKKLNDIAELVSNLYCIGNPRVKRGEECESIRCVDGMCLCLDMEQLGILVSFADSKVKWRTADEEGKFIKVTEIPKKNLECAERKVRRLGTPLIKCVEFNGTGQKGMDNQFISAPQNVRKIMRCIPIIKMANSRNSIEHRYTLCYLCAFFIYTDPVLINRFLQMVIDEVICAYVDGKEIETVLEKMILFVNSMEALQEKGRYKENIRKLLEYIDDYLDFMKKQIERNPGSDQNALEIYLWDFRERVCSDLTKDEKLSLYGFEENQQKFSYLCQMLKGILAVTRHDSDLFRRMLDKYICLDSSEVHDTFDAANEILCIAETASEDVKKNILTELDLEFSQYDDWSDAEIKPLVGKCRALALACD